MKILAKITSGLLFVPHLEHRTFKLSYHVKVQLRLQQIISVEFIHTPQAQSTEGELTCQRVKFEHIFS